MSDSRSVVSDSLQPHGLETARILCLWNSQGKNTGNISPKILEKEIPFPYPGDLPHPEYLYIIYIFIYSSVYMSFSQFIPLNTDFYINIIYNKINLTRSK